MEDGPSDDVLLLIFEHCDIQTRASLRLVCRRWNIVLGKITTQPPLAVIVTKNNEPSQHSNLETFTFKTASEAKVFLATFCKGRCLYLAMPHGIEDLLSILDVLDTFWKRLVTFELVTSGGRLNTEFRLIASHKMSRKITGLRPEFFDSRLSSGETDFLQKFANLKHLTLHKYYHEMPSELAYIPGGLETLNLPRTAFRDKLTDAFVTLLKRSKTSLRHFSCQRITVSQLDYLSGECPNIVSLSVGVGRATFEQIVSSLSRFSSLKNMCLRFPLYPLFAVAPIDFEILLKALPNLERFSLESVFDANKLVRDLVCYSPKLQFLHLGNLLYPREREHVGALSNLKFLKTLRLPVEGTSRDGLLRVIETSESLRNLHLDFDTLRDDKLFVSYVFHKLNRKARKYPSDVFRLKVNLDGQHNLKEAISSKKDCAKNLFVNKRWFSEPSMEPIFTR